MSNNVPFGPLSGTSPSVSLPLRRHRVKKLNVFLMHRVVSSMTCACIGGRGQLAVGGGCLRPASRPMS